jgi:hypothetical protein
MFPRNQTLLGRISRKLSRLITVSMIIMLASISACSDNSTEPSFTEDDRIQEATLRFMTELSWESYFAFVTFYIVVEATPYDNENTSISPLPVHLYGRLGNIAHPVRPFEECTGLVRHPDFVKPGIGIWVGKVTHIGVDEVVVYSGYYVGPLGAAGYLVRLEKKNEIWKVVDFDMMWIS